jgi:hypothetical protein
VALLILALYFGGASIQRLAIRAPRFSVFDDSSPDHKSHLMGLVAKALIGFDARRSQSPNSICRQPAFFPIHERAKPRSGAK